MEAKQYWREEKNRLIARAQEIIAGAKAEGRGLSDDERASVKSCTEQAAAFDARITDAEENDALAEHISHLADTLASEPAHAEPKTYRSAVEKFLDSEAFRTIVGSKPGGKGDFADMWSIPAIDFVAASDPTTSNPDVDLVQHLRPGIVGPFVYPTRVAPLFAQANMDGGSISYLFIPDGATGGADVVSYGGQKPAGSATLDKKDAPAIKIAATYTAPDDALDDLPALRGTLEQLLLVGPGGIEVKAEDQYVNGGGVAATPDEIEGILTLSPTDVSDEDNAVKNVLKASLSIQSEIGPGPMSALINPDDAFELMTLEPVGGDGRPLFSPFGGGYALPNWAGQWVLTKAAPAGTIVVGEFGASILYTRAATSISATNQGLGLFDYNLTMFRAETRQALVHTYREKAYRTVTLSS